MPDRGYSPSPAMDHRASFGKSLFDVQDDQPDAGQLAAMQAAKQLIYAGLARSLGRLPGGRAGVLVDERYGQPVAGAAHSDGVVLAVPVERSGRDWFELEWGQDWIARVSASRPARAAAAQAAGSQRRAAHAGHPPALRAAGPGHRRPAGRRRGEHGRLRP